MKSITRKVLCENFQTTLSQQLTTMNSVISIFFINVDNNSIGGTMFHIFNFILVLNKFHKTSMSHLKSTTLSNGKSMSQNYLITKKIEY